MKKSKKLLALLLASSLVVTACSTGNNTTNNQQNQTNVNQSLPKEDLLKKIVETNQTYKSVDLKFETIITPSTPQDGINSMKLLLDGTSILEPLSMKIDLNMAANDKQMVKTKAFLKDNTIYMQMPGGEAWFKTKNKELFEEIKASSNLSASDVYIKIFNSADKVTVSEKDGKYEITYTGDGTELQSIAEEYAKTLRLPKEENIKYKQANVKYMVDKTTLFAEKVEADLILTSTSLGDLSVKSNVTLSNHNKVTEITLPEEVKNATDIPA